MPDPDATYKAVQAGRAIGRRRRSTEAARESVSLERPSETPGTLMLDFDRFQALTFDCYGTLIDWETGIWEALRPVLRRHHVSVARESALEMFGALEAEAERMPYRDYKSVLREVLQGFGRRAGFEPSDAECEAFSRSVGDWPAFPDSAAALRALHQRFQLAIVSNVDDDLFAATAPRLGETFDWVVTAEQARSYKPAHENFRLALRRMNLPRERVLHVAQSLYHDIAPANALGLATVWVNRRRGRHGLGATPAAIATPDLEVPDLQSLASAAGVS
jgi:2-haloacid dehalogenase